MANILGPDFITILVSDLKGSYNSTKKRSAYLNQQKSDLTPMLSDQAMRVCHKTIVGRSENRKSRPGNHPLVAQLGRNRLTL